MSRRRGDSRTAAQWAAIAESTAQRLSDAPPRSLRAVVQMNLPAIELRLKRGWTIAQVVQELDEAGIHTTVAVFKNTLYRLRQKTRQQQPSGRQPTATVPPSRSSSSHTATSGAPIFKAKADIKNHF